MRAARRALAMTVLSILAASACSDSPEREYAIPKSLCKIPVSEKLIEPLLPPGKVLEETYDPQQRLRFCTLTVDRTGAIEIKEEWHNSKKNVRSVAREIGGSYPSWSPDRSYIFMQRGAATLLRCHNPAMKISRDENHAAGPKVPAEKYSIRVTANYPEDDAKANKTALKKLILAYTKTVQKRLPCEQK